MRTFEQFPKEGTPCPICKTNKKGLCVLIPITGTGKENIAEAKCFHLDCIEVWYDEANNVLFQKIEGVQSEASEQTIIKR